MCVNSYIQYKSDYTNEDRVYKCVAPDELQENLNLETKDVCIHGTYDSWVYHGPNVMVCRRCVTFADAEYRKQLLYYENKMIGKENTMHRSYATHGVFPKLERERTATYEFMVKWFEKEEDKREFSVCNMRKISKDLTTVIKIYEKNKTHDKDDDELIEFTKLIMVHMEKEVEPDDSHIMDINLNKLRQNIPITENEEVDESFEVIEISKLFIGLHKLVLSDIQSR